MALHPKIMFNQKRFSQLPAKKFNSGEMVKPASHCTNGAWEGVVEFATFMHGEWWYIVNNSYQAETTLQKV